MPQAAVPAAVCGYELPLVILAVFYRAAYFPAVAWIVMTKLLPNYWEARSLSIGALIGIVALGLSDDLKYLVGTHHQIGDRGIIPARSLGMPIVAFML
ncbi:hypothetical protein [Candidatus Villigracilis saccharophilus]|uniref:hypothetical protein n=1 Tax=Candidatus Villigracilis saccharophilus TaxID=3140684 RepID=UPI0031376B01|nr:hypothetical protein [Anaerolineales bacterium]